MDTLKEAWDHRYEHVKSVRDGSHSNLQPNKYHLVWVPVIGNVVASADYHLEVWTKLCEMTDEHEEISHEARIERGVVEGGECKLTYFKVFLQHSIRGPLARLKAAFHSNPELRPYYERRIDDDELVRKADVYSSSLKTNILTKWKNGPEEHVIWMVQRLVEEGRNGYTARHSQSC